MENKDLLDNELPSNTAEYQPSGWMQKEIFLKWFQWCVEISELKERKHFLCFWEDTKVTQRNPELIEITCKSHIALLYFPPRTTHKLQQLYVFFMALLN
jgi:hypothetical protein